MDPSSFGIEDLMPLESSTIASSYFTPDSGHYSSAAAGGGHYSSAAAEMGVIAGGECVGGMVFLGDKLIIGDLVFDKIYVANTVEQLGKKLDKTQSEQIRAEKEGRFADAKFLMGEMLNALFELDTMRHVLKRMN